MTDIATTKKLSQTFRWRTETIVGVGIIVLWLACAILGSSFVPFDPMADDMLTGLPLPDVIIGSEQINWAQTSSPESLSDRTTFWSWGRWRPFSA